MAEFVFLIKVKRLTKATLTTVKCCVKIQNDCSNPRTPLKRGRGGNWTRKRIVNPAFQFRTCGNSTTDPNGAVVTTTDC
jgi:hypothetical protein